MRQNIDTDILIRVERLRALPPDKLGLYAFESWRYKPDGSEAPDFVLNRPEAKDARILVAGDNFGCGSSREHAPWALVQFGFRAVVSTSFADIFKQNSLKNGLLPIVVPADVHAKLLGSPGTVVRVDLVYQVITLEYVGIVRFPIDEFSKHCLLEGVDELGYILQQEPAIAAYEAARVGSVNTLG